MIWVHRYPPRTRETLIAGAKFTHGWDDIQAARHAEGAWYEGKPVKGDGFIVAWIDIERGESIETYKLYRGGKFSREYFPGHSEEGKAIIDAFAGLGANEMTAALTSAQPITNPVMLEYFRYLDGLDERAADLEAAGFNVATESEARRAIGLLSYLDDAKAAHRTPDLDHRIVADNPAHVFTENNPQYAPFRAALENLRRLQGARE